MIKEGAKLVETATDILEELVSINLFAIQAKTELADTTSVTNTADNSDLSLDSITIPKPASAKTEDKCGDLDEDYRQLLNYLDSGPTTIDALVEQYELTAGEVSSMLLILELRGLVTIQPGGLYVRT